MYYVENLGFERALEETMLASGGRYSHQIPNPSPVASLTDEWNMVSRCAMAHQQLNELCRTHGLRRAYSVRCDATM